MEISLKNHAPFEITPEMLDSAISSFSYKGRRIKVKVGEDEISIPLRKWVHAVSKGTGTYEEFVAFNQKFKELKSYHLEKQSLKKEHFSIRIVARISHYRFKNSTERAMSKLNKAMIQAKPQIQDTSSSSSSHQSSKTSEISNSSSKSENDKSLHKEEDVISMTAEEFLKLHKNQSTFYCTILEDGTLLDSENWQKSEPAIFVVIKQQSKHFSGSPSYDGYTHQIMKMEKMNNLYEKTPVNELELSLQQNATIIHLLKRLQETAL